MTCTVALVGFDLMQRPGRLVRLDELFRFAPG